MHLHELTQIASTFLTREFGLELAIPIIINKRLKRALGRLTFRHDSPVAIELAANLVIYHSNDVIIDVLKHECVHYALFKKQLPFFDHDAYFENTLSRLNIKSTNTYQLKGLIHSYACKDCGAIYKRFTRISPKRPLVCSACLQPFEYKGLTLL